MIPVQLVHVKNVLTTPSTLKGRTSSFLIPKLFSARTSLLQDHLVRPYRNEARPVPEMEGATVEG